MLTAELAAPTDTHDDMAENSGCTRGGSYLPPSPVMSLQRRHAMSPLGDG